MSESYSLNKYINTSYLHACIAHYTALSYMYSYETCNQEAVYSYIDLFYHQSTP